MWTKSCAEVADIVSESSDVVGCRLSGAPTVVESFTDSKRELEAALRGACEEFIEGRTKQFVGPLLAFTAKLATLRGVAEAEAARQGLAQPAAAGARGEDSFAHPSKLTELLAEVDGIMRRRLPALNAGATRPHLVLSFPAFG